MYTKELATERMQSLIEKYTEEQKIELNKYNTKLDELTELSEKAFKMLMRIDAEIKKVKAEKEEVQDKFIKINMG